MKIHLKTAQVEKVMMTKNGSELGCITDVTGNRNYIVLKGTMADIKAALLQDSQSKNWVDRFMATNILAHL